MTAQACLSPWPRTRAVPCSAHLRVWPSPPAPACIPASVFLLLPGRLPALLLSPIHTHAAAPGGPMMPPPQEYLKRYCDAGTTAAVMDRAQARLQPYLACTTGEAPPPLRSTAPVQRCRVSGPLRLLCPGHVPPPPAAIELSEDLRKLRQKVYKLKDQDHDPAYTGGAGAGACTMGALF